MTGNSICGSGWTGISQRGVAYDVAGDTYFVGGWNEGVIYHIDPDGDVIDSAFVGLSISGLAYNPDNGHLLVMQNFPGGDDITVLDAFNNYAVLGAFPILDGGSPAITAFGGAGAEFDCLGTSGSSTRTRRRCTRPNPARPTGARWTSHGSPRTRRRVRSARAGPSR